MQAEPESPSWSRILEGLEPLEQSRQRGEGLGSCPEGMGRATDLRASWPASTSLGGRLSAPKQIFRSVTLLVCVRETLMNGREVCNVSLSNCLTRVPPCG